MPIPDDDFTFLLRRLARLATVLERHEQGGIGASASELFAMEELLGSPLTQNDLAERLGLEKSTISRLVSGMEAKGWVSRTRHPHNRRFSTVALTPAGLGAARHAADHLKQQHQTMLAALSPDERSALGTTARALSRIFSET